MIYLMLDCVFCGRILSKDVDALLAPIYGPLIATFEPLDPVTEGHRLFVPQYHYVYSDDDAAVAIGAAALVAAEYGNRHLGSYNIIMSNGSEATQTIPHIHVHLVPRTENDGLHLPWTGQKK